MGCEAQNNKDAVIEIRNDIQELFQNYIVSKILADTTDHFKTVAESQDEIIDKVSNLPKKSAFVALASQVHQGFETCEKQAQHMKKGIDDVNNNIKDLFQNQKIICDKIESSSKLIQNAVSSVAEEQNSGFTSLQTDLKQKYDQLVERMAQQVPELRADLDTISKSTLDQISGQMETIFSRCQELNSESCNAIKENSLEYREGKKELAELIGQLSRESTDAHKRIQNVMSEVEAEQKRMSTTEQLNTVSNSLSTELEAIFESQKTGFEELLANLVSKQKFLIKLIILFGSLNLFGIITAIILLLI